jgi:hypothetical protein
MPTWLISFLASCGFAVAVATLGFVIRMNRSEARHEAQYESHIELLRCIPQLQQDVASMKQADETFWKILGPHMSSIIQSPEHLTRDHLIRDECTLTYDEALELNSVLGHAFDDETDKGKKTAYGFKLAQVRCLLLAMDRQKSTVLKGGAHECQQQNVSMSPSSSWPSHHS